MFEAARKMFLLSAHRARMRASAIVDGTASSSASGDTMASAPLPPELPASSEVKRTRKALPEQSKHREAQSTSEKYELESITGISVAGVSDQLDPVIQQHILVNFPWIKSDAIAEIAGQCGIVLKRTIAEQYPVVEATKSRINFMSLSLELREMVYDLVLICDETDVQNLDPRNQPMSAKFMFSLYKTPVICLQQCEVDVYDGHTDYFGWQSEWSKQPALTRVSRAVRAETLPIYYKKNEFVAFSYEFPGAMGRFPTLKRFLSSIGHHNAGLIKHLTLLFPGLWSGVDGEAARKDLGGETTGLARAAVQMFKAGNFSDTPPNPHGFCEFAWGYQGAELGAGTDEYDDPQPAWPPACACVGCEEACGVRTWDRSRHAVKGVFS